MGSCAERLPEAEPLVTKSHAPKGGFILWRPLACYANDQNPNKHIVLWPVESTLKNHFILWSFRRIILHTFFPKASPMLGFSFSLLEGGVERGLTGPWCGRDV